jgi:Carboxypeptidase regulatory-like domain
MPYMRIRAHGMVTCFAALLGCAAFLVSPPKGSAQIAGTGNIQGTVTDSTGAVVPKASVILTNEATRVSRQTDSDSAGVYVFPGVPISTYDLSVTAPGFRTYEQKGIVLEVGSSIAVNAALAVGTAEMKVEVQSEGLSLQTEDATFKQTIDQEAVTEMPLNGRQMTALITLSGGSNAAPGNDFTGSKYSYQTISVSVAGGNGNTTLWRLDGGDNQDYMGNGNLPFPFPDAVSQFSVESTVLGAQDGEHTGGMVNVVTRSGTNTYHGSAFEFIRNNFIDATNFYSTSKDTLHQNQYGGTFGGKIIRDRLFAFAGYQHTKADQSQASTEAFVPTADNLAGNFSVTDGTTCEASGKFVQLLDPLTGATIPGDIYPTSPTFNAQALALEKYLPAINPSVDTQNCGLVSYSIPSETFDNQFVTRVDYTINPKNNLFARYFIDGYQQPAFYSPSNILITTQSGNIERVQTGTLGWAYTITPNLVNAAHATIMRRVNNRGYASNDINAATLGVSLYQAVTNGLQISEGKFTIGGGTNSVSHFNDNTLAVDDDVTWVRGRHQIIFGGEWVQNELNIGNAYESNGVFTFNGEYSGSGPNGGNVIGDQNLDFLWGTLSAFQQSKQQQNALRGPIPSLYAQDTFHATRRLTFVAGLRWGPNFMPTDYFNRGSVFNMANFLSGTVSSVYPNSPAGILFYGDKGVPRAFTQNSPWQFSPNVGFSFDPAGNGRTVLRAGVELAYDKPNFFTGQRVQQNPPFATAISNLQTSSSGPLSFSAPWSVGSITTNPFPQPIIPTPSQAQFFAQSQYIVLPTQFHAAYTTQWTLSLQHEFAGGWQMQLDYIGNTTRHDPLGFPLSPAVFVPGEWGAGGTGCSGIVSTGPAAVKPGAAGTNCSTTKNESSRFALTIANPAQGNQIEGGGGGSVLIGDGGTASYNGMIATLQHRLSSTFSLLANYTWSKCLDIADGQGDLASTVVEDPNDIRLDWGPCGFDYRDIENVVVVAKSNFHGFNRATSLLLNGWELAPLVHITSGAPVNVISGQDNSLTDVGNDRPNLVPGVSPYHKVRFSRASGEANREYLNPAAFAQVTAPCGSNMNGCAQLGTYGNVSKNAFRTPPFLQFDSQLSRIFPIHERLSMDFRLEAFNVLNHPDFGVGSLGANQTLTSSTFGQVSSTASGNAARVFQGVVKVVF